MDRELERILDDGYLTGLPDRSVAELRSVRAQCQSLETKLSYLRRLAQGRHDIVTGEIERRRHGGDPDDVAGLVERLPEILADRTRGTGPGRLSTTLEPGELSGVLVDRFEAIAEAIPLDAPDAITDAHLAEAAEQLVALEGEVSGLRRAMFERIDTVEAELTRRYRDGEAQVDDLLASAVAEES